MDKKGKLSAIVNACERRFDRGATSSWTHSDFVDLSQEIQRDTKVNISPSTLKRIFGKISVDDDYLPQQATIEALEKFGGYSAQEAGQTSSPQVSPVQELVPTAELVSPPATPQYIKLKTNILKDYKAALIVAIALMLFLALLTVKFFKPDVRPAGRITLTSTEGVLPATAFFGLQAPASNDSLFIDFGDKTAVTYVMGDQKTIAHNYLYPGVFIVKFRTRQDTLSTTRVFVRSKGWLGLGFNRPQDLPNHYYAFPAAKTGPDSVYHVTDDELYKTGVDTANAFFTRLCNFAPAAKDLVASDLDNFVFEATFKNGAQGKRIYCRSTQFQISGLKNILRFKLVSSGCSYRILNVLSERNFRGNKVNLSQFVIDPDRWNTVKLINKNKNVSLLINNKLLFTGAYKMSLGEVKGVFLEFEGNGFIKNCSLTTLDQKPLYRF